MCEVEFEKAKRIIEAEQGAPLEPAEEVVVRSLFYFGQSIKLKNRLEAEPEHVGVIAQRVFDDIEAYMERRRNRQRQARIILALKDFMNSQRIITRSTSRQSKF